MAADELEVLDVTWWEIHSGGCWNVGGGLEGQVTKCRWRGRVFFVRENLQQAKPSFLMSANERLGMKQGRVPTGAREVLEVACDPRHRADIVALVERVDTRGRRVREHARMTVRWALEQFERRGAVARA